MGLILINNGKNESSQYGNGTPSSPYYWYSYSNDIYPENISFYTTEAGTIHIFFDSPNISTMSLLTYTNTSISIQPQTSLTIKTSNANSPNNLYQIYRNYQNAVALGLIVFFAPDSGQTSTTSTTTSTTTQQPIGSKVFIHVGDINIPDNNCGRYKLTLDGAQSNYFSIYGKRIYLTTYPSNTGTYSVNVCAKDIANRFSPVCDTFDLTIKKCVFTTEPPTTTAAPNFGYVQSENSISTVSKYTYNKIYNIKRKL